ncbi:hypothetical protein [Corynebacterium yudongzhengii]|nr:hypothetical protein [Corynebacterium yudongzhengii]
MQKMKKNLTRILVAGATAAAVATAPQASALSSHADTSVVKKQAAADYFGCRYYENVWCRFL